MSGDSQGFFVRHRAKVWALTGVSILVFLVAMGIYYFKIPGLGFLVKPVMLMFYGVSGILLAGGYVVYRNKSGTTWKRNSSPDPKEQLSKQDAKELAEWDLFNRDDPIFVGDEIRCNVKPVTNKQEGTAIRVFEWEFKARHRSETYCYQLSLDQEIEYDPEWIKHTTEENMEYLDHAVREIQNPALERKSHVDNWTERLQENREEIGQAVRNRNIVEHLDEEGNVKRREKKQVQTVQIQDGKPPEPNKSNNEE